MIPGKKNRKHLLPAVCVAAVTILVALALFIWTGSKQPEEKEPSDQQGEELEEDTILWNGKEYKYNDHISSFLFVGVDHREQVTTQMGHADAGQTDAIFLLAMDRVEHTVTVISIPRDTITSIEVYGADGESLGKTEDHISLAYAYGDGAHESCRLVKEAVSNLLYGLQIEGYCALDLDGIPLLTESVGQVVVTVPNDSLQEAYPEFKQGEQVALTKDTTETFVRYRDTNKSHSALSRLERQQEYIRAFGDTVKQKYAEQPKFVVDLYLSLEPHMVTNMGSDRFAAIMEGVAQSGSERNWTLPGTAGTENGYDEYHVDEEALYGKIVETFYSEVK